GVVPDEARKKRIVEALNAQFGAANLSFEGFRVEPSARPFAAGWWENLAKVISETKGWDAGTLSFTGNTITEATGLPDQAVIQLKKLFGGWQLPFSLAGAESTANQANLEALDKLNKAGSIDEIVAALNISIINFAAGSSEIPASAQPVIEKAAEELRKQPANITLEIGGHTDSDGDNASNLRLSRSRADSVKKALLARGVAGTMLTARGYGETRPIAPNDTPDNKFRNRRIEYKIGSGN
ncbi:MAG: OmpA family protein, partial [Acidobacteriota bacterium]